MTPPLSNRKVPDRIESKQRRFLATKSTGSGLFFAHLRCDFEQTLGQTVRVSERKVHFRLTFVALKTFLLKLPKVLKWDSILYSGKISFYSTGNPTNHFHINHDFLIPVFPAGLI